MHHLNSLLFHLHLGLHLSGHMNRLLSGTDCAFILRVVQFYSNERACMLLVVVKHLFPVLFWGVNHTCPRECRSWGGHSPTWLLFSRHCPEWVNNPAGLLKYMKAKWNKYFPKTIYIHPFPCSYQASPSSSCLVLLVDVCWLFFWQFLFPPWIYLVVSFSSLLPLFPKTSAFFFQNHSLKITGPCFCFIWQD